METSCVRQIKMLQAIGREEEYSEAHQDLPPSQIGSIRAEYNAAVALMVIRLL